MCQLWPLENHLFQKHKYNHVFNMTTFKKALKTCFLRTRNHVDDIIEQAIPNTWVYTIMFNLQSNYRLKTKFFYTMLKRKKLKGDYIDQTLYSYLLLHQRL